MNTDRRADILWYIEQVNAEFAALRYLPVTAEQIECLCDPARYEEALEMVDDWESRLGLSSYWRGELAAYLTEKEMQS